MKWETSREALLQREKPYVFLQAVCMLALVLCAVFFVGAPCQNAVAATFNLAAQTANIYTATVEDIPDQTYTGDPIYPSIKVSMNGKTLSQGKDFSVAYYDNTEVGTATAVITGVGDYSGTREVTFNIVLSDSMASALSGFYDLDKNAWYMSTTPGQGCFNDGTLYLSYAVGKGLMNGYGNGCFGPDDNITRAQAVTVLWRMAGEPSRGSANFLDVDYSDSSPYGRAIMWAEAVGVASGYKIDGISTHRFGPNDLVTREQLAVMIYNYCIKVAQVANVTTSISGYNDYYAISEYAYDGIGFCKLKGIMSGVGGTNTINPQGSATRAQAAKMLAITYRTVV